MEVIKTINSDSFSDKINSTFTMVVAEGSTLPLTLKSVDIKQAEPQPGQERVPFSLIFEGTQNDLCDQSTYHVQHSSGFETEMFLVPIGKTEDDHYLYQAVYS